MIINTCRRASVSGDIGLCTIGKSTMVLQCQTRSQDPGNEASAEAVQRKPGTADFATVSAGGDECHLLWRRCIPLSSALSLLSSHCLSLLPLLHLMPALKATINFEIFIILSGFQDTFFGPVSYRDFWKTSTRADYSAAEAKCIAISYLTRL